MRTFPSLRVYVQRLDRTIERYSLPLLCLPEKPDLTDVRSQLEAGPLGKVERDIFFPSWTKSIHVLQHEASSQCEDPTWDQIEDQKRTIESAEELHEVLKKEEECPGLTSIILQQCRSKRYSRKKGEFSSPTSTSQQSTSPVTPTGKSEASFGKGSSGAGMPDFRIPSGMQEGGIYQALPNQNLFDGQSGPILFEQSFHPVGMFPPTQVYPPCYAIPVNVGCYNYISPIPAVNPSMVQGFYGYNVI